MNVGTPAHSFKFYHHLVTLHSGLLDRVFNLSPTAVLHLPSIKATNFANFVIWMQSGTIAPGTTPAVMVNVGYVKDCDQYEGLWIFGHKIKAPGFRNYCMGKILERCATEPPWPTAGIASMTYSMAPNKSPLHKLVVMQMSATNPSRAFPPNLPDAEWKTWRETFEKYSVMMQDMCLKLGTDDTETSGTGTGTTVAETWNHIKAMYMVETTPISEVWAKQIVERRSAARIRKQALKVVFRAVLNGTILKKPSLACWMRKKTVPTRKF